MIRQNNIKLLEIWREDQSIKSSERNIKIHPRRNFGEQLTRNVHGNEKLGDLWAFTPGWTVLDLLGRSTDEQGKKGFQSKAASFCSYRTAQFFRHECKHLTLPLEET